MNFNKHVQKDLKGRLAGAPTVRAGGVEQDHYKGLGHSVAAALIPFAGGKYEATEFIAGSIPLNLGWLERIHFQIPALHVKNKYVAGVGQFGAVVGGSLSETVVSPRVGMACRFMPLQTIELTHGDVDIAAKMEAKWGPEAKQLNADKKLRKAAWPKKVDTRVSGFYVKMNKKSPIGFTQMAPWRGKTVITAQRVPLPTGFDNRPFYSYRELIKSFSTLAGHLAPQQGGAATVGKQVVTQQNIAMMGGLIGPLDR